MARNARNGNQSRQGGKGLDQLLKGKRVNGQRSVVNRSFQKNVGSHLQTENNAAMEMSVMLVNGDILNDDDDIVIDSGGRQINHVSNWHASFKESNHSNN